MGKSLNREEIRKARQASMTEDFEKYSKSKDEAVRMAVAENLKCPMKILALLSEDPDENVRWSIAMNPHTPTECLEKLASDKSPAVREGVAMNSSVTSKILEELSEDDNGVVRSKVLNRINMKKFQESADFDLNALMIGLKIKCLLLKDHMTSEEVQHFCQQILLGKAVENYLNHNDYELREILNESFD